MNWSWQICSTRYEKLQLRLRPSQATLKGIVMNHLTRVERFYSFLSVNLYHDSQENVLTLISINLKQHPAWNIHFTSTFDVSQAHFRWPWIPYKLCISFSVVREGLLALISNSDWPSIAKLFLSLFLQFPSHTTASYNVMWWDVAADCITSKTVLYLFIKGLPEHKGNIFKFFKFIYIKVALGDFSRYFALY